jgi:ribonuclease P/MRP protein subunit RPP40
LTRGVVQGSCLGPLLFILYVNDICKIFNERCTGKLYVDDVKCYTIVELNCDHSHLQKCLDDRTVWSKAWQLKISFKKCFMLYLGRQSDYPHPEIYLDNETIARVEVAKDLGVNIDNQLKFDIHIRTIVSRAHQRANLILKCFRSKDISTLVRAFIVYVRPILEYASVIWSPYLIKDIKLIEAVLKRFTKRLPNLNRMNYEERLKILGLQSLELRRLQNDLITVYKILFDKIDVEPNFLIANCNSITRGHSYKLFLSYCHSDVRKHFLNNRIVQPLNELTIIYALCHVL